MPCSAHSQRSVEESTPPLAKTREIPRPNVSGLVSRGFGTDKFLPQLMFGTMPPKAQETLVDYPRKLLRLSCTICVRDLAREKTSPTRRGHLQFSPSTVKNKHSTAYFIERAEACLYAAQATPGKHRVCLPVVVRDSRSGLAICLSRKEAGCLPWQ